MYAKKNKPMYGKGGAMRYENGGPVKKDSTNVSRGREGLDLFGMEAVLRANRKRNADMEGLSEVDKLRRSFGVTEGGSNSDLFGMDAVLDARESKGLSRNPLEELMPDADYLEDKRQQVLNYLVDIFNPSSEKKIMKEMKTKEYGYGGKMKYKKGGFPDLTGDGKVTMADILKGRGVGK